MLGSVVSHRKGEVDRVAGVSKIYLKNVSNDYFFENSSDMVSYIYNKFTGKAYVFKMLMLKSQKSCKLSIVFHHINFLRMGQMSFKLPSSHLAPTASKLLLVFTFMDYVWMIMGLAMYLINTILQSNHLSEVTTQITQAGRSSGSNKNDIIKS